MRGALCSHAHALIPDVRKYPFLVTDVSGQIRSIAE